MSYVTWMAMVMEVAVARCVTELKGGMTMLECVPEGEVDVLVMMRREAGVGASKRRS